MVRQRVGRISTRGANIPPKQPSTSPSESDNPSVRTDVIDREHLTLGVHHRDIDAINVDAKRSSSGMFFSFATVRSFADCHSRSNPRSNRLDLVVDSGPQPVANVCVWNLVENLGENRPAPPPCGGRRQQQCCEPASRTTARHRSDRWHLRGLGSADLARLWILGSEQNRHGRHQRAPGCVADLVGIGADRSHESAHPDPDRACSPEGGPL